jgi:hypothetical protein
MGLTIKNQLVEKYKHEKTIFFWLCCMGRREKGGD